MRLFIAEKPSLARAIADALPQPHRRSRDSIQCGESDVVAWCAGHVLELAPPAEYNPDYKQWRLDHLPIVPQQWILDVTAPDLLKTIKTLLKSADRVVHAGDPDREGQLLVDEVLDYLRYKGPVDRVLLRDLSPDAVRQALGRLEPNTQYHPLRDAALARQRADWLYGLNMTRLYTLLGRAGGYNGVLSVGRVQTPLLGLIVQRDLAIETFRPIPYFAIQAKLATPDGTSFLATWVPGQSAEPHLDPDRRLLAKDFADALCARLQGQPATVVSAAIERKSEPPPLPYSLADLQIDAARRYGLSAEQTLQACQALYEQHQLATYPRSDCSYLPAAHLGQAKDVLAAVARNVPSLAAAIANANLSLTSKAWNDKKVTAHHAIIPTTTSAPADLRLSDPERYVYDLIIRRYLAQFYPHFEYSVARIEIDLGGERFVVTGRQILADGWKTLVSSASDGGCAEPDETDEPQPALPSVAQGDTLTVVELSIAERQTRPPKPFTDASLIEAMCGIARFVADPKIKAILAETDGIGTPATRASIIETLFSRDFIRRSKKTIRSTPTGRALIASLPDVATSPDMTAIWEAAMRAIADGEQNVDAFLGRVLVQLRALVDKGRALGKLHVAQGGRVEPADSTPKRPPHVDVRAQSAQPKRKRRPH